MNKLYKSKKWMERRINRDQWSAEKIADFVGCSPQTIYSWAKKHGIKI